MHLSLNTRVGRWALAMIGAALVFRTWVAATGYLYWDDLILLGRGSKYPLLSADLLLYDHDGHFMPAAFFVAAVVARVTHLGWVGPVVTLVVLQGLASLSVLRLLRVLLADRAVLLVPLAVYLLGPLTLTSFTWWSAALNALPLQIGMAWVCADAVVYVRTGRPRYAISALLALALSLAFFEKSVVIPGVAFTVVALVAHVDGERQVLRSTARRGWRLWVGALVLLGAWALLYVATVKSRVNAPADLSATAVLLRRSFLEGVLPATVGGPWAWDQVGLSTPFATPPLAVILLGCASAVAVVGATMRWRSKAGVVWLAAALYLLFDFALMVVGRSGSLLTPLLALTLRYFADGGLVLVIAVALVLRAAERPHARHVESAVRKPVAVAVCLALVVSAVWSTVAFTVPWSQGPTRSYLTTARASLAEHSSVPMLDQPVPDRILWGLAYPNNLASQVFRPLAHRPAFSDSTSKLQVIDESGAVVPAHLKVLRTSLPGQAPTCGYHVVPGAETVVDLDGALISWGWTTRLSFLSAGAGTVTVQFDRGGSVTAAVVRGPGELFVRLVGEGSHLRLRISGGVQSLCLGSAMVGLVAAGPAG